MHFTSSPLSFSPQFSPLIQRNLLILHLRSFLLPLSLLWTPLLKDNDTDKGHLLTLDQSSSEEKRFPSVLHFPLVPWCTLGHASSPWQEALQNAAVELSPSYLVCINYLLCSVKDTGHMEHATLDDRVLWESGSTVRMTYIWCAFPIGMRDSPNLFLLHLGSHD